MRKETRFTTGAGPLRAARRTREPSTQPMALVFPSVTMVPSAKCTGVAATAGAAEPPGGAAAAGTTAAAGGSGERARFFVTVSPGPLSPNKHK